MENAELQSLSLKLLVRNNRVVFLESNKDFVDVLFSFMTLPIGKIIKLTAKQSVKGEIGCLNNLYTSIQNLDEEYLRSQKCRDVVLHPRSAAEISCRNLKVNLNERDGYEYYTCESGDCSLVSYYQTGQCRCGEDLDIKLTLPSFTSVPQDGGVFMKPVARFMITDDFQVMPLSTMTSLNLLRNHGAVDGSTLEERIVKVGRPEVLELLKRSLVSRTPVTEIFLQKPQPFGTTRSRILRTRHGPRSIDQSQMVNNTTNKEREICLKLIVNTSINRALYAEVEEDFVDLLCSFLTFPLGFLFENFPFLELEGFNGCMDNLHKSIQNIEVKLFKSEEIKEDLLNSKLAPGLAHSNQLINIKEATKPSYNTIYKLPKAKLSDFSSQSRAGETETREGFIKGPASKFMVMEDLKVMPLSPISGLTLIKEAQIPLSDIGEQEVTMGEDEALRLFVTSLVSKNALTDVFLLKEPEQEQ